MEHFVQTKLPTFILGVPASLDVSAASVPRSDSDGQGEVPHNVEETDVWCGEKARKMRELMHDLITSTQSKQRGRDGVAAEEMLPSCALPAGSTWREARRSIVPRRGASACARNSSPKPACKGSEGIKKRWKGIDKPVHEDRARVERIDLQKCSGCGKSLDFTEFWDPSSAKLHAHFRTCSRCRGTECRQGKNSAVPPEVEGLRTQVEGCDGKTIIHNLNKYTMPVDPVAGVQAPGSDILVEGRFANNTANGKLIHNLNTYNMPGDPGIGVQRVEAAAGLLGLPAGVPGTGINVQAPGGSVLILEDPTETEVGRVLQTAVPGPDPRLAIEGLSGLFFQITSPHEVPLYFDALVEAVRRT